MLTLYIANRNYSSWSMRPWLVLKHLGLPFREVMCPFGPEGATRWTELRAQCSYGKVPCLIDSSATSDETGRSLVIWESLAIVEYLHELALRAGISDRCVWPSDVRARSWARSAAAEMHAGFATLRQLCSQDLSRRFELHTTPQALERDLARINGLVLEGLSKHGGPWLAGEMYSAVDAFYAPVAFRLQSYGVTLASREVTAYMERLRSEAHAADWYAQALLETWRDESHDRDCLQVANLLKDLR